MAVTYRYAKKGKVYETHLETLELAQERALSDLDQERADPLQIRDGRKILMGAVEIMGLWEEKFLGSIQIVIQK